MGLLLSTCLVSMSFLQNINLSVCPNVLYFPITHDKVIEINWKQRERERERERERMGGVSAVSGHMTRKMWGLIPVLDCSQLLKLCPSQCKPYICPITTPATRLSSPHGTMAGKAPRRLRRHSQPPHWYRNTAAPDRTGAARTALIFPKHRDFIRRLQENSCW